jgi:hypothetical protein
MSATAIQFIFSTSYQRAWLLYAPVAESAVLEPSSELLWNPVPKLQKSGLFSSYQAEAVFR